MIELANGLVDIICVPSVHLFMHHTYSTCTHCTADLLTSTALCCQHSYIMPVSSYAGAYCGFKVLRFGTVTWVPIDFGYQLLALLR